MQHYAQIRELIDRVRARWRALCALQAVVRGALMMALVFGIAVVAARWTVGAPVALMALALASVLFMARGPAREAVDAASLTLFPARVSLDVRPGNARIKAGSPLAIEARLVGNQAPVIAQMQIADGEGWRTTDMSSDKG